MLNLKVVALSSPAIGLNDSQSNSENLERKKIRALLKIPFLFPYVSKKTYLES